MSKYHNKKTTIDGIKFDSKLESDFYLYLKSNSDIELVSLQPVLELLPKTKLCRAVKYIPDFEIVVNNVHYYVDAKGIETPVFKLKMNLYKRKFELFDLIIAKSIKELDSDVVNLLSSVKS